MKIFKIVFIVLLISLFCFISSGLSAQTIRYPMSRTFVTSDTDSAVAAGKEIYGYTIIATSNTAAVGLHDLAVIGTISTSTAIAEAFEATSGNSQTIWFPKPLITANGCSVKVTNAETIIYHQP